MCVGSEARLTINGVQAAGQAWPTERGGGTYGSTSCLAFSESWTEPAAKL